MNLIPTLISIGLAASVSVFYLQNQSDEPNKINYRAALSDFEQTALEFAAHTPLQDISAAMPPSHCASLSYDFEDRLPAGSESAIDISGLNCDMATLKISTSDEKDFQALLSAASASGRSYATETDTSATPPTKTIKWTQRLYSRNTSDLGIKAKLKNTYTGNCISCTSSTRAIDGDWSHKPDERWGGCPAPGVLACGETGTRRCNNPPPSNYGKECPRINKSLTSPSNRDEKRNCLGVPKCGQWVKESNCPINTCVTDLRFRKINRICRNNPCKLVNGSVVNVGYEDYCDTPLCGNWDENQCDALHCLLDQEEDPKKICDGHDGSYCKNNKGTLTPKGQTESCSLQACSPLKTLNACPTTINNCYDPAPIKELKCEGPRCKINGKLLNKGEHFTKPCPYRPCGKLTVKKSDQDPPKKCIPKNGHMYNDQPTITHTCVGGVGCKDEKGNFYETNKSITTVSSLPGCPYWGVWKDNTVCGYKHDKNRNESYSPKEIEEKQQQRKCYRRQSNGVAAIVGDGECEGLDNYNNSRNVLCEYPWGKWERTGNCLDNCINDNQRDDDYDRCNAGNNTKLCKAQGIIYNHGHKRKCSDVKPICGKWSDWSACEFDDNKGYGSCDKKDGIQTRECSKNYCKDPTGTAKKTDTQSCYTEKCQINIDNNIDEQRSIDNYLKGDNTSKRDVKVIISKNSYITAPNRKTCAIRSRGNFKKLKIINYGIITGYGGEGGAGAKPIFDDDWNFSADSKDILKKLKGENGKDGGSAICISKEIKGFKIENYGTIEGGRAGGGGGGAICYSKRTFVFPEGSKVLGECAFGGDGGNGSDLYLPTIFQGKSEQTITNDTFLIQSGAGGNGGVLFKEGTLEVDQIPRTADRGKQGHLYKLDGYAETSGGVKIEVIKGKSGYPGVNGKACTVGSKLSDCDDYY